MCKTIAISLLLLSAALLFAPALHAQGCAMCYTTAAGQDPAAARKLDMAILALLIPVLTLFAGVMALLIHRRNGEAQDSASPFPAPDQPRTTVRLHLEFPQRP